MTDFVPLPMIASKPVGDFVPMPDPQSGGSSRSSFSARCPISRTVALSEMASGTLLSGTVYRRDLFLCGPFEGAVQGLWLAASKKSGQPTFQIGLVDETGAAITAMQQIVELDVRAKLLLRIAATTANRSLYLRVETTVQDSLLYVTLDVTLDEVM